MIIGCYFWYQWHVQSFRESIIDDNVNSKKTINNQHDPDKPAQNTSDKINTISNDQSMTVIESIDKIDITREYQAENKTELLNQPHAHPENNIETEPVSPFGFGHYPKVPDGYPYQNPWITNGLTENEAKISELLERVRIKLWNQGKPPEGISWENGKVYPIYPNTIYVSWDYSENQNGVLEKYPGEIISGTMSDEADMLLDEGVIPDGITVYEMSEAGIDPYTFLNLNK